MRITSPKILVDGKIENVDWEIEEADINYINEVELQLKQCQNHLNNFEIKKTLLAVAKAWDLNNKLIQMTEPWNLKKDPIKRNKLIYLTIETIRTIGIILYPIVPEVVSNIYNYLNW